MVEDEISLPEGLAMVEETLVLIREVEALLAGPSTVSFRERLIVRKEELEKAGELENPFMQKAALLLARYEDLFGVDDFIDYEA